MQDVLTSPAYAEAAKRIAAEIGRAGGVARAADIVEAVLQTGQPVLRDEAGLLWGADSSIRSAYASAPQERRSAGRGV
jgi:hypothetical protein